MLLVVCEPDLVHCAPVEPMERLWDSVESCRLDRAPIEDALRMRVGDKQVVMSTCRLFLDEGQHFQRSLLAKKSKPADRFLF